MAFNLSARIPEAKKEFSVSGHNCLKASPTVGMMVFRQGARACSFLLRQMIGAPGTTRVGCGELLALLTKPLGCDTQGFAVRDASRITHLYEGD